MARNFLRTTALLVSALILSACAETQFFANAVKVMGGTAARRRCRVATYKVGNPIKSTVSGIIRKKTGL